MSEIKLKPSYDDEFKHDLILVLTSINDNLARLGDLILLLKEYQSNPEEAKGFHGWLENIGFYDNRYFYEYINSPFFFDGDNE